MKPYSTRKQEDERRLAERAAEWLDVLERADPQERAEFAEWITDSPRHAQEVLFVTALGKELKQVDLRQFDSVRQVMDSGKENVVPLLDAGTSRNASPVRHRRWIAGVAAAIAVSAIAVWWFFSTQPSAYTTAVGEQRTLRLEDGSTVELNTQSQMQVRFSAQAREIHLVQGEALFAVQKDPARPFTVVTDDVVVKALATQFNVYRQEEGTTVTVVEGRVSLTAVAGKKGAKEIAAGDTAHVAADGAVSRLAAVDTANAVAWREHRLVFLSDTLTDIAAEFNRYNRSPQLVVPDAKAGERRYSGTFDSGDPQSLIQFLREDSELALEQRGDELVIRRTTERE